MTLSSSQSKLIAIGLLVVSSVFVWAVILSPLMAAFNVERQQFSQNLERLSRYESLRVGEPAIAAAVDDISQYVPPVYAGANTSSILAAMQRDIGQLATSNGLNISSIRPLNNSNVSTEGYLRLILRVDLTGTTSQLATFIVALRNHTELLITMNASIRATDNGSASRAANISISLELAAFGSVVE